MNPLPPFIHPSYFDIGMTVWIDCRAAGITGRPPGTGLRCEVIAAHGVHARIVNRKHNFETFVHLYDVVVKDPPKNLPPPTLGMAAPELKNGEG